MRVVRTILHCATVNELLGLRDAGGDAAWLGPGELRTLACLRDLRRRAGWIAGRLLAKRLIVKHALGGSADAPGSELGRVEIQSGDVRGRRFRPEIAIDGRRLSWSLSISHTERGVLVGLAVGGLASVGVDLVEPAVYGDGFADVWFTPREKRWVGTATDPYATATVWAIKEAVYKAVNRGESFAPRRIEVLPDASPGGFRASIVGRPRRIYTPQIWRTPQGEIAVAVAHYDGCPQTPGRER